MPQQRAEKQLNQGHQRNCGEKLVLWKLASMPDTENCRRIPRKIPKTRSVEVVVGDIKLYKNNRYLQYLLEYVPHSLGYNN